MFEPLTTPDSDQESAVNQVRFFACLAVADTKLVIVKCPTIVAMMLKCVHVWLTKFAWELAN